MKKRGAFVVHDQDIATQDLEGQAYDFNNYAKNIETAIAAGPLVALPTEDLLPADIGRRVTPQQLPGGTDFAMRKGGRGRNIILYAKYDGQQMKDIYHSRVVCGRVRPHIPVAVGKFANFSQDGHFLKTDIRTPYVIGNKDIVHEWALPRVKYLRQGIFSQDLGFANFGKEQKAVFEILCVSTDAPTGSGGTIEKKGTEAILTFSEPQMLLPVVIASARKDGGGNYFAYTSEVTFTSATIKVRNESGTDIDLTDVVISVTGLLFTGEDFAFQTSPAFMIEKDDYEVVVGEKLEANIRANDLGTDLSILKVNGSEALVGTQWTHSQGGKVTVLANGDFVFETAGDANFTDIIGTRTKTIVFTYTAGNPLGQQGDSFVSVKVKAAPISVTTPGPFEVNTKTPKSFDLLTNANNPHGVIKVSSAFGGHALVGGSVTAEIANPNGIKMELTITEAGKVHYNPVEVDTTIPPNKTIDTLVSVTFSDGNSGDSRQFIIRQKNEAGAIITSITAVNDDLGYVTNDTTANVLANDEGSELEVYKVAGKEENVGMFTPGVSDKPGVPGGKVRITSNGDLTLDVSESAIYVNEYTTIACTIKYSIRMKTNHAIQSTGTISYQYTGERPPVKAKDDQLTVSVAQTSVSFNVLANDTGFLHRVYGVPWNPADVGKPVSVTFTPQNIQAPVTIQEDGTVIFNPSDLAGITDNATGTIQYSVTDDESYSSATLTITVTP